VSESETVLPELLYKDLEPGREFPPMEFRITEELVARYREAIGESSPLYESDAAARDVGLEGRLAPVGLWGVWGRAAYLQDHQMPGGGVLAGEDVVYVRPARVGDVLAVQARVVERYVKNERRRVLFETTAHDQSGALCGVVRIAAIWPK
jgi:acyl dehydratase